MRFAVLDPEGDGLSWAARLHDEGHEILYYIHQKAGGVRGIGENIVPRSNSLFELLSWAKLKPTIAVFMFSGMGKRSPKVPVGAEEFAAAGVPVLLGGALMDRLENDRDFGAGIAKKIGVRQPPTFHFENVQGAQAFCKAHKSEEWYFKPNDVDDSDTTYGGTGGEIADYLDYFGPAFGTNRSSIVQMKVPGIAVSTAAWFNGHVFLEPVEGTIEHKKLMNDDIGPSTGCAINTVWMYPEHPKIADDLHFKELAQLLEAKGCNPGLIDINAVVSEEKGVWGPKGVPYFLEWTPRLGWDSEATSHRLLKPGVGLGQFLDSLSKGTLERAPFSTDTFGYGVRLSLSPYPYMTKLKETPRPSPQGKQVRGVTSMWRDNLCAYGLARDKKGLYMAEDLGIIGVAVAYGKKLSALHEEVMKYIKKLQPTSIQYRTDGAKVLADDAKRLNDLGYSVPSGIME
jgi:phosphoribosylamine--glycine ligase